MELAKILSISDYCNIMLQLLRKAPLSLVKIVFISFFLKTNEEEISSKRGSQEASDFFFRQTGLNILNNGDELCSVFDALNLLEQSNFICVKNGFVSKGEGEDEELGLPDLSSSFLSSLLEQVNSMTDETFLLGVSEYVPY
jgi:hypothetical protein